MAFTLFVMAAVGFVFPHLAYPPLLFVLSRMRRPRVPGNAVPSVTLVVSAYNEAPVIRDKIENSLALDYPCERMEVMVISDASDDGTDEIVQQYANRNVRLCRQAERRGKSVGLSRFCPEAQGEILVFTDANSMFRRDALAKLVRHFDNPSVGYSVGCQLYDAEGQGASADSESFYWSIELRLKQWESRLSSVVGADGAIYALRRELFEPLSAKDINDFVLPLKVVAKGYRGVFDAESVCYEEAAPSFRGEFHRKYRIVNRSVRAVLKVPQTLNPFRVGWFSFQLIAHKVLRWLGPVFLLVMLITSAAFVLVDSGTESVRWLFVLLLAMQLTGYGLAASYLLPPLRNIRLVYIAYYFFLVNVSAAVGLGLLVSGHTIGVWKPQR